MYDPNDFSNINIQREISQFNDLGIRTECELRNAGDLENSLPFEVDDSSCSLCWPEGKKSLLCWENNRI